MYVMISTEIAKKFFIFFLLISVCSKPNLIYDAIIYLKNEIV